jgi:hypothetical protein
VPTVIILIGTLILLYHYFFIYIPADNQVQKLAINYCHKTHSFCPGLVGPEYWIEYAIAGWATILIGIAIGISYFYLNAILLRQNTAS